MARDLARHLSTFDLSPEVVDAVDLVDARRILAEQRARHGFKLAAMPLLGKPEDNVKTAKGEGTFTLSLAPADASGVWNVCRYATADCRSACVLSTSGKGTMDSVRRGRAWKTTFLADAPAAFLRVLVDELSKLPKGSLVRLNTASDLPWEALVPWLFDRFPTLRFYDYTKWTARGALPENYRLTFSISERQTLADAIAIAASGRNVAVVVNVKRGDAVPSLLGDVDVVDGDTDDNRFDDPQGVIVALRAKGAARIAEVGDRHFVKAV